MDCTKKISKDWTGLGIVFLKSSLFLVLMIYSVQLLGQGGATIQQGKVLFNTHCAACHKVNRKAIGPALAGASERYDREWLYSWIRNSSAMISAGDPIAVALFEEYNQSVMTAFPQLSDEDIDNILAYTDYVPEVIQTAQVTIGAEVQPETPTIYKIFLIGLIIVLVLLVVMLYFIQKRLIKIKTQVESDFKPDPKIDPIWKAFVKNQFLVLSSVILLFLVGLYQLYGYMMQIGIDKGYQPIQPIHFSHKIHSGDNQIDCKYCHSSARVSKHSGIPSLNICMNCHQNIAEYTGEEDLAAGYTQEFYTAEIKKLYTAVGWDEENQVYTSQTQPVRWIRIHNLPDFVYFNHAQHAQVAGIDCQTCHGPVEEMEILYQYAPLTMGWCIDCHRETNVDLLGNEYYQKVHEQLSKKYGVEQLTVAQMGGLECAKCHY